MQSGAGLGHSETLQQKYNLAPGVKAGPAQSNGLNLCARAIGQQAPADSAPEYSTDERTSNRIKSWRVAEESLGITGNEVIPAQVT